MFLHILLFIALTTLLHFWKLNIYKKANKQTNKQFHGKVKHLKFLSL